MTDTRSKISATADTFIHYLFASLGNERFLLSLVNAVRENAGQPPVKETRVMNPFNPKTFLTEKQSVIDIKAVAENNHSFVIEFQMANHPGFMNRGLYYWAKTYSSQLLEGNIYDKLSPVILMVMTCFPLCPKLEKLHNTFWITAQDDPTFVLTENLQIHTVELVDAKFGQLPTIRGPLRKWLEFFHYSNKKSEAEMKALLQNSENPVVTQAYDVFLRFNQDEKLRQLEDVRQMFLHDYNSDVAYARQEGRVEGRMEGEIEREAKAVLRILTRRFRAVPKLLETRIFAITDLERLEKLADFAFECKSLDEFTAAVK